jgi:hypothetical protein
VPLYEAANAAGLPQCSAGHGKLQESIESALVGYCCVGPTSALPDKVHDAPLPVPLLDVANRQHRDLRPREPTGEEGHWDNLLRFQIASRFRSKRSTPSASVSWLRQPLHHGPEYCWKLYFRMTWDTQRSSEHPDSARKRNP